MLPALLGGMGKDAPWRMLPVCPGVQPRPCPTDESSLKMNHVEHIPQTLASHSGSHLWEAQQDEHGADMLKADPRDTFFLSKCLGTHPFLSLAGFGGGKRLLQAPGSSLPPSAHLWSGGISAGVYGNTLGCFGLLHSPCHRGVPRGERAGALCLQPHLRGEGFPHRPLPGPAVRKCHPGDRARLPQGHGGAQGRDAPTWVKSRRKCPLLEGPVELAQLSLRVGVKSLCLRCWESLGCWSRVANSSG